MKEKTFIECMLSDLDDIDDGTEVEVEEELIKSEIDIEKAKKSFKKILEVLKEKNMLKLFVLKMKSQCTGSIMEINSKR